MDTEQIAYMLEAHDVRATSNRILVMRALLDSDRPLCLADLEERLQTLEKSSVSRVLSQLASHGLIHALEDGRGITRYELCHGDHTRELPEQDDSEDLHVHFYCERCRRVFCFPALPVPPVHLPARFTVLSANYMLKGICPDCDRQ